MTPDAPPDAEQGVVSERPRAPDPVLVAGGRLYLRVDGHLAEEVDPDWPLFSAPGLLELSLDVRPTDRVRGYASGRFTHDFGLRAGDTDAFGDPVEPTEVLLDQLWLKGDVAERLYWTVGQQRIEWGSGRIWNPTDVLNRTVRDPLDVYDERVGVPLVKLHAPVGSANLYAVGRVEGARVEDLTGALRAEVAAGPAELAITGAWQGDGLLRLGGDVSAGLGPVDVHVEGAVRHGDPGPYWSGTLDFDTLEVPVARDRTDDWIPQVGLGAEVAIPVTPADTVYVGAEGLWNDAGYDDPGLYPWLFLKDDFVPLWVGRLYAAAYVHVPSPGRLDDVSFTGTWIANLSDGSQVSRVDARWVALGRLSLDAYVGAHFGRRGELNLAIEVPAIPDVVTEPITYTQPPVDLGVGASLAF